MPGLNLGNLPERFADDYSSIVIIAAIISGNTAQLPANAFVVRLLAFFPPYRTNFA